MNATNAGERPTTPREESPFADEFIVCGECGGRFDLSEWDAAPEAAPAAQGDTGSGIRDTTVASRDITTGGTGIVCKLRPSSGGLGTR